MAKTLIPFKGWHPGYKGAPPAGAGGPVYITEEEYKKLTPSTKPTPTPTPTPAPTPTPTPISTQTPTPTPTPTPTGIPIGGAKQNILDRLTAALTAASSGPSLEEQRTTLRTERGLPGLGETIGTFEEEIDKTKDLLSDLDARIRRGMGREEARLAPLELVTGRQAELGRQAGYERGDVLAGLETYQRGKERAESTLEREEADILTILGLREQERKKPLEALQGEIFIRKSIRDLTKTDIPDVVSSQFNDVGDLTVITQDPNTGAFSPQTIKGIGKKGAEYNSFSTQTDDYGNVTIIGVKPDGTTKILGTFEGVAGTKGGGEKTGIEQKLIATRGTDGYVDPKTYTDERTKANMHPTEFDKRFSHLLSPQERINLGIVRGTGGGAEGVSNEEIAE